MSQYSNGFAINISDVARLIFKEGVNDSINDVASISMSYEVFKKLHEVMGKTIAEHDERLAKMIKDQQELN